MSDYCRSFVRLFRAGGQTGGPMWTRRKLNLGGHQPYVPVVLHNDKPKNLNSANAPGNSCNSQNICGIQNDWKQRARVLCLYDAKDSTELNLSANEIIFATELSPLNSDYMYGKQGLINGLVPKAFLELLEE